jgi:hypothetical protein
MKSFKNKKGHCVMWALVPYHGAECEETLIFTDEYAAMTHWRGLPDKECVLVVPLYQDADIGAWVLSEKGLKSPGSSLVEKKDGLLHHDSSD